MQLFSEKGWRLSAISISLIYLELITDSTYFPPPTYTVLGQLTQVFQGNLLAGFLANLAFIIIAAKLDSRTEEKIDKIEQLALANEVVLRRREEELEEQTINQFEKFMKVQNWHDARFPDIQTSDHPIGLEYTIRPFVIDFFKIVNRVK